MRSRSLAFSSATIASFVFLVGTTSLPFSGLEPARRMFTSWRAGWLSCPFRKAPQHGGDAANCSHGQESSPRRIYGRVCGWRAMHAISLDHWITRLLVRVRAEAED